MKLGFFELITIILLVAKLLGYNDMEWYLVYLPVLIGMCINLIVYLNISRKTRKHFL